MEEQRDDPIPELKVPEKRKSSFDPVPEVIESNGHKTMPHIVQEHIKTWCRHGSKIIKETKCSTLISQAENKGAICIVTVDQEKAEAVIKIIEVIDQERKAKRKKESPTIS